MAGNGRASDRRPERTITGESTRTAGPPIPGVVIVWSAAIFIKKTTMLRT
jgi:hypothetical protein